MTRALAVLALALAACVVPSGVCSPTRDPGTTGRALAWLDVGGVRWRVQHDTLPDDCSGVTTWAPTHHTVTFAEARPNRASVLHELGHVLIGREHLPMGWGVLSARHPPDQDLTYADLEHCRARGVCHDGEPPPPPADEDPILWAVRRWNGVTRAPYRIHVVPPDVTTVTVTIDPSIPRVEPRSP